jgi:hypothetical protein
MELETMKRGMAFLFVALTVIGGGTAFAQSETAGPGVVEITTIPGGGTFFTEQGSGRGSATTPWAAP